MRRLSILWLVVALLTGGAVASAQLLKAIKLANNNQPPKFAFDPARAPLAPDYAARANWAALPDMRDEADVTPEGVAGIDQRSAPVDVFYIYPTVFMSKTAWNADTRDTELNRRIDLSPVRAQASVFNGCCAIYAPRYRQMTLGGYIKWSANSEQATELAYRDVARAFRYYLATYNKGRPFIIAGHSQGSRLARLLIEREIDGKPVARQMVAAYLIGHWIERAWFDQLRTIRACMRADDTGCVVTWSSYAEGRKASIQRVNLAKQSRYAPEAIKRPYVCINPLSWTTGPAPAPRSANLGGWLHGPGAASRAPDAGLVSARCVDGAVYVSAPPKGVWTDQLLPFGNFHNYDYNLFYMNLRANAADRAAAFLRR